MHFGALRVLNDDQVAGGMGFGTHPHSNMEIVSIPLYGDLEHKDSMGNVSIIQHGDIQVMSAGSGISHSEQNKNREEEVKFLQIWIVPQDQNVVPRYDQRKMNYTELPNTLHLILTPTPTDHTVWIHQEAWFSMGVFNEGKSTTYAWQRPEDGVYFFVLKGSCTIGDQLVQTRDGYGVWNTASIELKAMEEGTEVLVMEVPMI